MKILVYEHVSGGGYAGRPIPEEILSEGFGMLRSVVADFAAAGHEVTILIDARLSKFCLPLNVSCKVIVFYPKESEKFLSSIAKINDATYIIAPEAGQTLHSLVKLTEKTGKVSLNCKSESIGRVANKMVLYDNLKKHGFSAPKTLFLKFTDSIEKVRQIIKNELSYPVVFKPVDSVGCCGISILKEDSQIQKAIDKIKVVSTIPFLIVQEFIEGESASICLISTEEKALAISLNKQNVNLAEPIETSSYEGGCVPYEHHLKQTAFCLVEKLIESFQGLRGYIGVDLVFSQDRPYVVDVNPRLTTSYVGLRKVARFNIAEALVNAVLKGKLPTMDENRDTVCFSKIETAIPTLDQFQKITKLDSVISPPFPLKDSIKSNALVIGEGKSIFSARQHLEEAKKNLRNIIS